MPSETLNWKVAPATAAELPIVVEGNLRMARETEDLELHRPTLEAGCRAVFEGRVDAEYLLARHEGADETAVAGQLMLTREWSDWRNSHVLWIQSVYVWPAFRRKGVYRALHTAALRRAREQRAAGVRLYVDARNHRAMQTYGALGMDGEHYRVFEAMFTQPPPVDPG